MQPEFGEYESGDEELPDTDVDGSEGEDGDVFEGLDIGSNALVDPRAKAKAKARPKAKVRSTGILCRQIDLDRLG